MNRPIDSGSSSSEQPTTSAGTPSDDNQNSLSAGPRGPLLLQEDPTGRSGGVKYAATHR